MGEEYFSKYFSLCRMKGVGCNRPVRCGFVHSFLLFFRDSLQLFKLVKMTILRNKSIFVRLIVVIACVAHIPGFELKAKSSDLRIKAGLTTTKCMCFKIHSTCLLQLEISLPTLSISSWETKVYTHLRKSLCYSLKNLRLSLKVTDNYPEQLQLIFV